MRELWLEIAAVQRRDRLEYERDVKLAWATEYMARQKTLDNNAMKKLLKHGQPVRQTPAELKAYMEQLSATLGVALRREPWPRA